MEIKRNRVQKKLWLSQQRYINKVLERFNKQNSKPVTCPLNAQFKLSSKMSNVSSLEVTKMEQVPYASAVGSLMYAMLCTRPDFCFVVGMVSRYQKNLGQGYWTAVKHIMKYLKRTKDYMLVYQADSLVPLGIQILNFSVGQ